ncbi:fused response regulator/phosphatase [Actinomadura parmotrematis]|uniref:Fused response regulator/phosphatase n=1 Tax=Actinomadura parmotrematis TaxID=2864039 RepID=A0ABS7FNG0_9ACTN|nr:fused response regulator/phosphatase [Actinomadura parmotrematis]MBW8481856.1 fused response regulator/phosphatase [Actinomadura parmotrematis]
MTAERCTTLVVDDNDTKRYIIGSWLRRAGHTVVEAASAAGTWERLAETDVDLIVLDVMLPDMSGIEVCERIKAAPDTAAIPVIHISAAAVEVADRTHGLRQGADAYMTDPIDPGEFIATVDAVLRYYRARRRAELMASRMAALTRTSLALNSAEGFDRLTAIAAAGAAEIFGVTAAVFILPPDGRGRRTVSRVGEPPWYRECPPSALADLGGLLTLGDGTGTAVALVPGERLRAVLPDAATDDDAAMVMVRTKRGRPPILVCVEARGVLDEDEFNLLRQLGQMLALAMEALRSYTEEHQIALTLQRSLLPAGVPDVPGWRFAVRYEPSSDQAEVGGDFYEVLDRGDEVLVAIGDVQGHSLHAATVMAEIRHALRAFAEEGHDAVAILGLLNGVMQRYHDDQTATVCIMTLDPRTGELAVANAGHLAPLYVGDGEAHYGKGGGVLLGFPVDGVAVERTTVPPGGSVLLYTDGLIEDRGVPLSVNMERLRVLALGADLDGDLEQASDRVISAFGHREDDVALVVLHRAR